MSYQQRSWNFNFLPGGILRWRICMQRGHYLALQGLHHGDAKPCNYITYITIILLILQLYYLALQGFIMLRLNHTMCIRYIQTIIISWCYKGFSMVMINHKMCIRYCHTENDGKVSNLKKIIQNPIC